MSEQVTREQLIQWLKDCLLVMTEKLNWAQFIMFCRDRGWDSGEVIERHNDMVNEDKDGLTFTQIIGFEIAYRMHESGVSLDDILTPPHE